MEGIFVEGVAHTFTGMQASHQAAPSPLLSSISTLQSIFLIAHKMTSHPSILGGQKVQKTDLILFILLSCTAMTSLLVFSFIPSSVCSCTCYGGNTKTGGMAAVEQRVNSRKGRQRKQGTSRYGRPAPEPSWSSKTSKFWRRIMVFFGFCEQVIIPEIEGQLFSNISVQFKY